MQPRVGLDDPLTYCERDSKLALLAGSDGGSDCLLFFFGVGDAALGVTGSTSGDEIQDLEGQFGCDGNGHYVIGFELVGTSTVQTPWHHGHALAPKLLPSGCVAGVALWGGLVGAG
jgi:hypothetical protein